MPPELVELGRWVGEEYCSTPSRGLGLVLPPGIGTGAEARRRPAADRAGGRGDGGGRGGAAPAESGSGSARRRSCARSPAGPRSARAARGERRRRPRRDPPARGARPGHAPARSSAGGGPATDGGRRRQRGRPADRRPDAARSRRSSTARSATGGSFLLHGVTGSGKTEVYLEAAREALERGRGVIVLVPEIALTPADDGPLPPPLRRARWRCCTRGCRPGARYDEWRRLRSGEARICVGPALGRVRAGRQPRPDRDRRGARLLLQAGERPALRRPRGRPQAGRRRRRGAGGRDRDAAAGELGRAARGSSCPSGSTGAPLPPVEVVDMRGGRPRAAPPAHARGVRGGRRATGGKAILLINRRGWSTHLACRSCGHGVAVPRTATCRWSCTATAASAATTAVTPSRRPSRCPSATR